MTKTVSSIERAPAVYIKGAASSDQLAWPV